MTLYSALHIAGATITAGMGVMALINPRGAAQLVSVSPLGKLGMAEMRATYGGLFLALGGFAIFAREPEVFVAVGLAWGGAAAGRMISVLFDGSFSARNIAALAFEAGLAWLMLTPRF